MLALVAEKARRATRPGWGATSEQSPRIEPYVMCVPSDNERRSSSKDSDSSDDEADDFGLDMAFDPTLRQDRELGFYTVA